MSVEIESIHRIAASEPLPALKRHVVSMQSGNDMGVPILSAVIAQHEGHPAKAITMLRRAMATAAIDEQEFIVDLMLPVLLMQGRIEEAESYLNEYISSSCIAPLLLAMRSLIEAIAGRNSASQESSRQAIHALGDEPDEVIAGLTQYRLGCAAYYRGDWSVALDYARVSSLKLTTLNALRPLAAVHSLAYNVHHAFTGDYQAARIYAGLMTDAARSSGDVPLEILGLTAQYELAAETADEDRVHSLALTLRRTSTQQQLSERFPQGLGDSISSSWMQNFDAAAASAHRLRETVATTEPEIALALALRALASAGQLEFAEAASTARATIALGAVARAAEAAHQYRYRRLGRALAGAACIIIGDRVRGARAVSPRSISSDPGVAAIIGCALGAPWERAHPTVRGYARMVSSVLAAVTESASQHGLTKTEVQVLQLLADGMSAPAIALATNRSVHTVRTHTRAIIQKLQVQGRNAAVATARRSGII